MSGQLQQVTTESSRSRHYLFLSHSGADTAAALALRARILQSPTAQQHGLDVFVDAPDLRVGQRWKDQLQEALAASTGFAVYVGARGVVNWVWDEVSVALDRAHDDPAYPIISILTADAEIERLPNFLRQFHALKDIDSEDALAKLLRAALRLDRDSEVEAEAEPFQGLAAFSGDRAHLFYGREAETAALVARVITERLVMVVGDSGSGKSSLVKAGLVPKFHQGALAAVNEEGGNETKWQVVETRPGGRPFQRLASAFSELAAAHGVSMTDRNELEKLIEGRNPDGIRRAVRRLVPEGAILLLVVDQFEELFTLADAADQTPYTAALLALADPKADHIRVVATMRWDYYHLCASVPSFYDRLEQNGRRARFTLDRMTETGLRATIEMPLQRAGVGADERAALAGIVLKDIGLRPSNLALLEMALTRAWAKRNEYDGDLIEAYLGIGRVEGALAVAADETIEQKLRPEERAFAEPLFIRLVKLGDIGGASRRIAGKEELGGGDYTEDVPARTGWELAQKLAQKECSRLTVVSETTAEITHEALVTSWAQYVKWLANNRETNDLRADDKRLLDGLMDDARRWSVAPESQRPTYLTTGADLKNAEQLSARRPNWLSKIESAFVQASARARWRQRALRYAAVGGIVALSGVMSVLWQLSESHRHRADKLLAESKALLELSEARRAEIEASSIWAGMELKDYVDDWQRQKLRALNRTEDRVRAAFLVKLFSDRFYQEKFDKQPEIMVRALTELNEPRRSSALEQAARDLAADKPLGEKLAALTLRLLLEADDMPMHATIALGFAANEYNSDYFRPAAQGLLKAWRQRLKNLGTDDAEAAKNLVLGVLVKSSGETRGDLFRALASLPGPFSADQQATLIEAVVPRPNIIGHPECPTARIAIETKLPISPRLAHALLECLVDEAETSEAKLNREDTGNLFRNLVKKTDEYQTQALTTVTKRLMEATRSEVQVRREPAMSGLLALSDYVGLDQIAQIREVLLEEFFDLDRPVVDCLAAALGHKLGTSSQDELEAAASAVLQSRTIDTEWQQECVRRAAVGASALFLDRLQTEAMKGRFFEEDHVFLELASRFDTRRLLVAHFLRDFNFPRGDKLVTASISHLNKRQIIEAFDKLADEFKLTWGKPERWEHFRLLDRIAESFVDNLIVATGELPRDQAAAVAEKFRRLGQDGQNAGSYSMLAAVLEASEPSETLPALLARIRNRLFGTGAVSASTMGQLEAVLQQMPLDTFMVEVAELLRYPNMAGEPSDRLVDLLRRRSAETGHPFKGRGIWDAAAWLRERSPAVRERLAQPPAWIAAIKSGPESGKNSAGP